jgi:small subunit ribosomal protein S6
MPKYEMMYIVASSISDDQIPSLTDGVLNLITALGGAVLKEEKLGKKKLAYPVAKTRNGFYELVQFEMEPQKLTELNNKVRTTEGVIRHLIINIENMLERMAKDAVAQEAMNRKRSEKMRVTPNPIPAGDASNPPKTDITDENLDEKIEQALTEDLSNV